MPKPAHHKKPSKEFPLIVDMLVDFAIIHQKYDVTEMAKRLKVTRQALENHINKRKKELER